MTLDSRVQVDGVLGALRIQSDGRYSWFGERARHSAASQSDEAKRILLERRISNLLYRWFYVTGGAVAAIEDPWLAPGGDEQFVGQLRASNRSVGPWQKGWKVEVSSPLMVSRDGVTFVVRADAVRRSNEDPRSAEVHVPSAYQNISPGFFMVLGDIDDSEAHRGRVRYYFNLRPSAGPKFISGVTTLLNRAQVPFRAKVLNHPAAYRRADAAVLYVPIEFTDQALGSVARLYERLSDAMRSAVPALSRLVAPGLSFAHEPGDGRSFGEHRCDLIARGLVEAHARGHTDASSRVRAIEEAFDAAGVDLSRPHLARSEADLPVPQL